MECCLSESEHSAETDKDTTGSEYEDPDTDVTEPSTDSDDDLDAPETEWLLDDDHSRPAQYWKDRLKRLQREGLDFSTLGDYSEGTTNLLNRIEEQWELHCREVGTTPAAAYKDISTEFLYNFFDWLLDRRRGKGNRKLRGTTKISSLELYWKLFRLVYERATNNKLPSNYNRSMRPVIQRLAKVHGLSNKTREKVPMDVDDLTLMIETTLTTSHIRFSHGRHRIQICLFLVLMSLSGNRPDALLKLRYQDLEVNLLRDPEGGPHRILIEFTPEFTKSFRGTSEANKWPIPEVLFDPSLVVSPHVYLLALMFADDVFEAPSLRTLDDLSRLYIEDFSNQLKIPLKSKKGSMHIFRPSVKTPYGCTISETLGLKYSTLSPWLKKVAAILGLQNFIPYSLRYNAATKFDGHEDVSDSLRNLMMRHADARTLVRHYLPRRITVDSRAIVHDLEPQKAMMKAASRMSRSIDPRRPYELTVAQSESVNQHPHVLALTARRVKLKRKMPGLISRHKGSKRYEKYSRLNRAINNTRQRERAARLKQIREEWEQEQPVIDIERQLAGAKFTDDVRTQLDHSIQMLPQQKCMIETLLTLPGQSLEEEVSRRNKAIQAVIEHCNVEEGGTVRRNHRPALSLNTTEPESVSTASAPVSPIVKINVEECVANEPSQPIPDQSLQQAVSSVYNKKRTLICFVCLGNCHLPTDRRVRQFHSHGTLSMHFRRKHLSKAEDSHEIECKLCKMTLRHKMHFRRHADEVHGVLS